MEQDIGRPAARARDRAGGGKGASRLRLLMLGLVALSLAVVAAAVAQEEPAQDAARFRVTEEVVSPGFGPFTATVAAMGAGSRLVWAGSGFEPAVVRTRWIATEDAPDRIVASPEDVAQWDTLRSGALDGARVDVYRVREGRLDRVRTDRIAPGGHQAAGWMNALPDGRMVPGGETAFDYAFDPWNRPAADYWFAVQAVGPDGEASAPSEAVRIASPAEIPERGAPPALVPLPEGFDPSGRSLVAAGQTGPPAPVEGLAAALTETGAARLTWTAQGPAPAGWRVLISDAAPETHRGYYGLLEGGAAGAPIKAGDLAILSKTFDAVPREGYYTNRVWDSWATGLTRQPLVDFLPGEDPARTWRLVPHDPDTPVTDPGETYLRLSLARGASARIGGYNYGGAGQHWYEVLEPGREYVLEFWARADHPGRVRPQIEGPYGRPGRAQIRLQNVVLGRDWRHYALRFTPRVPLTDGEPGWMGIEVAGPGTFDIDNLRIRPADTDWLDLEAKDYARLQDSGVEALRTHGLIKSFRRTYDLGQLTASGGATGLEGMNTLPQSLGIIERAGVDPWLQVEPHLTPEEWTGLVEYLAAPAPATAAEAAARPWAARRAAQGRAAPWSDAFDRIYFEVGNETWNGIFEPWTFPSMRDAATGAPLSPGTVYGLYQEHVIRTLRASPWWAASGLEDKVVFVLGGWGAGDFSRDAAFASPSSDLLTMAAYNGGWDAGKGPVQATPQGFFEVLNDVSQSSIPDADRLAAVAAEVGAARGRPLAIGTYEAGPGYALDGLNGDQVSEAQAAEQERVMKSAAAGAATLDAFLARAERGLSVQNFFLFREGRTWSSHARSVEGGQAYPSWTLLAQAAALDGGEMLRVEADSVPRADLPPVSWRSGVKGAPLVGLYAARQGDRLTLTAISRRVPGWPEPGATGETEVVVDLPFARASRATRHRLTGDYAADNTLSEEARPVVEPLPPDWFAEGRLVIPALPPGVAEVYVFEGIADE